MLGGFSRLAFEISGNSHQKERGPGGKSHAGDHGPHPPWLTGEAAVLPSALSSAPRRSAPLRSLNSVFRNTHRRAYVFPGLGRAGTRALSSSNMAKESAFVSADGPTACNRPLFFFKPSPSSSRYRGQVAAMFAERRCVFAGTCVKHATTHGGISGRKIQNIAESCSFCQFAGFLPTYFKNNVLVFEA